MKILFQGDGSSDDPGRLCPGATGEETTDCHDLGEGYPRYAAVMFTDTYPDTEFTFYRDTANGDVPDLVCFMPDFLGGESDEAYEAALAGRLSLFGDNEKTRVLLFEPFLAGEDHPEKRDFIDGRIAATRSAAAQRADVLVPLDGLFAAARIAHPDIVYADENGLTPEGLCFLGECCLRAAAPIVEAYLKNQETT